MYGPKLVKVKNRSKYRVVIEDFELELEPGEVGQVPEAYLLPRRGAGNNIIPSVIDNLAPCAGCDEHQNIQRGDQLVHPKHPALEPVEALDGRVAGDEMLKTKRKMPSVADLVAAGVPVGVAEQMFKAMIASAASAREIERETKK